MRRLLITLAAVFTLGACTTSHLGNSTDGGRDWVAAGDSIFVGMTRRIQDSMGNDGILDAVAARGIETDYWGGPRGTLDALRELIPTVRRGGWIIVEEDGGGVPVSTYAAFVDEVTDLAQGKCVAWVTPMSLWAPDRDRLYGQAIRAELADHPCSATVEWADAVLSDPSLVPDNLHPSNPRGMDVLGDLIEAAI